MGSMLNYSGQEICTVNYKPDNSSHGNFKQIHLIYTMPVNIEFLLTSEIDCFQKSFNFILSFSYHLKSMKMKEARTSTTAFQKGDSDSFSFM